MTYFACIRSRALTGMSAPLVEVEAHLANGLPSFNIVGLAETEVKESRDRVRAAITQSGFDFPTKKIIINLAPAELPKESARFDLPIAIAILAASKQINNQQLNNYEFAGELALSGLLRPVRGALLMAISCAQSQKEYILPEESAQWAAFVDTINIYAATSLADVVAHLNGLLCLPLAQMPDYDSDALFQLDMNEVKGQESVKYALEIAATGGHSILMKGPPGTGKSMLAQRLPTISPPLSHAEVLENIALYSLLSEQQQISTLRPFRSPHHSASAVALIGGGSDPRPGEISLANHGILFLDELPEFDRKVLEVLREPLENGEIHISRALRQVTYPAKFQLVAAMNPCPCGYFGHSNKECHCSIEAIHRYQQKISGPLLDRIDLLIDVPSIPSTDLINQQGGESSKQIKQRVIKARERQINRQGVINSQLTIHDLNNKALIKEVAMQKLGTLLDKLHLSARGFHRILKVARSIADIEDQPWVEEEHVLKALAFRRDSARN